MRMLGVSLLALAVGTSAAWAQQNVKNHVGNQLGNALDQHNQQLEDAMNGGDAKPQPAVPAAPAETLNGWITRKLPSGQEVRLYFAHPPTAGVAKPMLPALIVLQEWWGVNDDIQERTRDLAAKGFYAVAVDLYDGKVATEPKEAAELKKGLTDAAALVREQAGLALLMEEAKNGTVDPARVGVIGWCMGGEQALKLAVADPRIKATAIFYGPLVKDADKLKNLKGPVLGIFGNEDKGPSPADVNAFDKALTDDGIVHEIYRYDGAGHAFASVSAKKMGAYREQQAKDAWEKCYAWLDKTLGAKK